MLHILKCKNCNSYSLHDKCKKCSGDCVHPKPAKYSPEDQYGKYRREGKKKDLEEKGLI